MLTLPSLSRHVRPLIVAVVLVSTVTGALVGMALAQEDGEGETPTPEPSDEETSVPIEVKACAECHPDVAAAWEGGPHAMALEDPLFQQGWDEQDFDPGCLECHTTGYVRETGEYRAAGITCEECHGVTPEGHPPEPVDLNHAAVACTGCHRVTQAEFRASSHEDEGLVCTSCHYAHSNGLRLATEIDQCLDCHDHQLDDFAHASHIQADLTCRDCHGYVEPGLEIPPDGLGPTGHDFQENMTACLDCHQDIELVAANGETSDEGFTTSQTRASITGGQQAELRASQLEAVLQTLLLQQRNRMAVRTIQGGVGGLLLGGLGVWLFAQREQGSGLLSRVTSFFAKLLRLGKKRPGGKSDQ